MSLITDKLRLMAKELELMAEELEEDAGGDDEELVAVYFENLRDKK